MKPREIPYAPNYFALKDGTILGPQGELTPTLDRYGYAYVHITRNGRSKRYAVHQLILLTYRGPCPPGKTQCRHLNGIPSDNRLQNLKWGSHEENELDKQWHSKHPGKVRPWR
ncbi:hypothetical protein PAPYRUS_90 [Mycobacterium phage Papyrus]|uniref:HNH endonuclease n=3 Tax=Papyrusvirus TaxID=1982554 RepID=A0A2P1JQQ7_9CAUD|nr:HNH endonuclease [Mycobacterium phage Papyrus]AGT14100.1 hypothetical protein PAPYRUS_90 [Mycobacterium phage Papyrus]ARW57177.1 hypothetical protein SEA_ZENON_92 [Mycobacterium phage Zenon]AVO21489.1 HNH endonuclease [Mycobacterium phage Nilo]